MNIQWFPGHMTKAIRQMKEDIKLIDLVIEICDARIPVSSRNPEIDDLARGKERIVLLNKSDLADPDATQEWVRHFEKKGIYAVSINARERKSFRAVDNIIEKAMAKKRKRDESRGIRPRPVRTIIVGIPNSGKSTFINSYAKGARAKTGNTPGVTRGKQWIRRGKSLELLDTPGILWPKFEDETVGIHLACVGSIKDQIVDTQELAVLLIEIVNGLYPDAIRDTYGIESEDAGKFIDEFADSHGCLIAGGERDIKRACTLLLTDFRAGKWGRLSIEKVAAYE